MRFRLRRSQLPAVLLLLAALVAGCAKTAPEQRLRDTITTMQAAVEARDGSALMEAVATDFIGPEGLDRDGARRMAQMAFLRYRDVGVSLGPMTMDLQAESATVRFTAVLTGGAGLLPDRGQAYDVETGWRAVDGEWELVNARWAPRL